MKTTFKMSREVITILFSVLTALVFVSAYFLYEYRVHIIRQSEHNKLSAIAELKLNQILDWRKDLISEGRLFSEIKIFVDAVESFIADQSGMDYIYDRLSAAKRIKEFSSYAVFDKNLNVRYSDTAFYLNAGSMPEDLFSRRQPVLSNILPNQDTSSYLINLYIPIMKGDKEIAIIVLQQNPEIFIFPLIQSWPAPSNSSETLIFMIEGENLIYLNKLRHSEKKPYAFKLSISERNLPAAMLARGITGVVEGIDYRGHPVLADLRAIPGTEWYLVTKVDKEEVFSSLDDQLAAVIGFSVLFLSAAYLGILLLWNRKNAKFTEQLYRTESEKKQLLEKSLNEKEFLMKEIHHRVKNNLQIISSILRLQAGSLHDESLKMVFEEAVNRINIFALIHRKLYSHNAESVNAEAYFPELIGLIRETYYQKEVSLEMDISPVELKLDNAIYLGLILNEIVSNCYKHAFNGITNPRIMIQLCLNEEKLLVLKIADNGVGIDRSGKESGIGLLIIESMTDQLNGEFSVKNKSGTEFIFYFKNIIPEPA